MTRIIREDLYRRYNERGQLSINTLPYMQTFYRVHSPILPLVNFTDLVNSKNKNTDETLDTDIILRMNLLFH